MTDKTRSKKSGGIPDFIDPEAEFEAVSDESGGRVKLGFWAAIWSLIVGMFDDIKGSIRPPGPNDELPGPIGDVYDDQIYYGIGVSSDDDSYSSGIGIDD